MGTLVLVLRSRFANGIGALHVPAFQTHTQIGKGGGDKRLYIESTNTQFLKRAIIASYHKLHETLAL